MKNIYIKLVYILFFLLPLVNTKLGDIFFIPTRIWVDGNYEFTKTVFFNVCMGLIFLVFFGEKYIQKKKIIFPKIGYISLILFFIAITLSTIFSLSPYDSLFGNGDKSHSFFLFINLMGLLVVLYNTKKKHLATLLNIILLSSLIVCFGAIKEFFFPTFDYGALGNRAFGTFGHPNYLALYLLILLPFVITSKYKYIFGGFFGITLICTKSLLGVFLGTGYILYLLGKHFSKSTTIIQKIIFIILFFISVLTLCILFIPVEKLHSFISRFYIWKTTVHIIVSDIQIFIFGAGLETLSIYFNSFKVPELYIYENFGFTADRPHNFFLNTWYHLGILGIGILLFLFSLFYKHIQRYSIHTYEASLILFFAFTLFNYPSISVYCLIVFIIGFLLKKNYHSSRHSSVTILIGVITCISLSGAVNNLNFYQAEIYAYQNIFTTANSYFPHHRYLYTLGNIETAHIYDPLPSEKYYYTKIQNFQNIEESCKNLTNSFPSVENFFYCGKVLERIKKEEIAKVFYVTGLKKLPDLWNKDSDYWDDYIIKKTISGNRFFSTKFSNLEEILETLNIEKNSILGR